MMTQQLQDALNAAIASGMVSESSVFDLISHGHRRRKNDILERVSKSLDEGVTEAELVAVIEKAR